MLDTSEPIITHRQTAPSGASARAAASFQQSRVMPEWMDRRQQHMKPTRAGSLWLKPQSRGLQLPPLSTILLPRTCLLLLRFTRCAYLYSMGQRLASCSRCFTSCCSSSSGAANPKGVLMKPGESTTLQSLDGESGVDVMTQPLVVVEDESWKRWSSYNLIHNASDAKKQESAYTPPVFVSTPQQQHPPAEAVWDL